MGRGGEGGGEEKGLSQKGRLLRFPKDDSRDSGQSVLLAIALFGVRPDVIKL